MFYLEQNQEHLPVTERIQLLMLETERCSLFVRIFSISSFIAAYL